MTLKKRIEITRRGYAILAAYNPGLIRARVISAMIEALSPFVTIWFSARIINELAGARNKKLLLCYVLLTIGIHLVFSMIKNVMDRMVEEKESCMWEYFRKIFSDKQMSMDYVDLENLDIQKQQQKAKENLFMFGNGLGQLVWDTADIVRVTIGILASVSLTV